jgi:hypothetical protein
MRNMEPLTGTAPSSQPCVGGCLRQRLEAGEVRNGRITRLPDMRPLAPQKSSSRKLENWLTPADCGRMEAYSEVTMSFASRFVITQRKACYVYRPAVSFAVCPITLLSRNPQVIDLAPLKSENSLAHKHMFFEQSNFRVLGHPIENGHEVSGNETSHNRTSGPQ